MVSKESLTDGEGSFYLENNEEEEFYTSDGNYGTSELLFLCIQTDEINNFKTTKTVKSNNLAKKPGRLSSK